MNNIMGQKVQCDVAQTKALIYERKNQEEMHKKYSVDGTGRPLKHERRDPPCLTDRWLRSNKTPACITFEL